MLKNRYHVLETKRVKVELETKRVKVEKAELVEIKEGLIRVTMKSHEIPTTTIAIIFI